VSGQTKLHRRASSAASLSKGLSPIERGIVLALMAAGRPLRELADFRNQYGIRIKPAHRAKLQALGLIETTARPFTHALTVKGWQWAREELEHRPPEGLMGLGPLYAILNGLHRALNAAQISPQHFFQGEPEPCRADIVNAAWSEADEALALALQDLPTFERVLARLDASSAGEAAAALKQVKLASELVFQHIRQAAAKRGLTAIHARGEQAAYDPVEFDSDNPISLGAPAAVLKRPIVKRSADGQLVVVRGLAGPAL
jgi:hypothetical protein